MTECNWKVVIWKHLNCGGESLIFRYDDGQPFSVVTGPSLQGAGSWGPFPSTAIQSVRDVTLSDSWIVSGTLRERWNIESLLRSLTEASMNSFRTDPRIRSLASTIQSLKAAEHRLGKPLSKTSLRESTDVR